MNNVKPEIKNTHTQKSSMKGKTTHRTAAGTHWHSGVRPSPAGDGCNSSGVGWGVVLEGLLTQSDHSKGATMNWKRACRLRLRKPLGRVKSVV